MAALHMLRTDARLGPPHDRAGASMLLALFGGPVTRDSRGQLIASVRSKTACGTTGRRIRLTERTEKVTCKWCLKMQEELCESAPSS